METKHLELDFDKFRNWKWVNAFTTGMLRANLLEVRIGRDFWVSEGVKTPTTVMGPI